jgi:hypothetical protein
MQEKVNLWKKPNVGLARPIQPTYRHPVTHRGLGALPREMVSLSGFKLGDFKSFVPSSSFSSPEDMSPYFSSNCSFVIPRSLSCSLHFCRNSASKDLKSPSLKPERDQDRNKCDDNIVVYRLDEKDENKGQTVDDEKDDTKVQTVDDEVNRLVEKDETKGQTVDDEVLLFDL